MIDWQVFVDESGDLGPLGSKYFIIAAVQVRDAKLLERIVKRVRQRKLKKTIKQLGEIKAVNSTPEIRKFVLRRISSLDCKIYVLAMEKKRILSHLMEAKDRLYNWVCRLLCQQIEGNNIQLVFDKKYSKMLQRADLETYLRRELEAKRGKEVSIEQLESQSCRALQAVDFIAWTVNRKYSHGDDSYYKIIEGKIANRNNVELWSKQ